MKYLIIATLVSFVLALIYLRVRPYLKLIRKVTESLTSATDVSATRSATTPSSNKLVRCEKCGTWVPADRPARSKWGPMCAPTRGSRPRRERSASVPAPGACAPRDARTHRPRGFGGRSLTHLRPSGAPARRCRVPGLRAVPPSVRGAERRLRRRPARTDGPRRTHARPRRSRGPRRPFPARTVGRAAAARRAGPRARAGPGDRAPGRAVLEPRRRPARARLRSPPLRRPDLGDDDDVPAPPATDAAPEAGKSTKVDSDQC